MSKIRQFFVCKYGCILNWPSLKSIYQHTWMCSYLFLSLLVTCFLFPPSIFLHATYKIFFTQNLLWIFLFNRKWFSKAIPFSYSYSTFTSTCLQPKHPRLWLERHNDDCWNNNQHQQQQQKQQQPAISLSTTTSYRMNNTTAETTTTSNINNNRGNNHPKKYNATKNLKISYLLNE